ncbi:MAG: hypothetical protein ACHQFW_08330, partial [Chitinophagales bacterium]
MQYRFSDEWAFDINAGYVDDIEGSFTSINYEKLFKSGVFYYKGPFVKFSMLSVIPRGPNPLRTDYNQLEVSYKYLTYEDLDFEDENEAGKLFNISEKMHAIGLSWKAGYNIIPRDIFEVNGFVGFGIQLRFKSTLVNSYGYNYQSDQFPLDDESTSTQIVPLFHTGIKIGFKAIDNIKSN